MRLLFLLTALVFALPAYGVDIEWVTVSDPGNDCHVQPQGCFGSAESIFRISKYEVTNAQYAEFLDAVADMADDKRKTDLGQTTEVQEKALEVEEKWPEVISFSELKEAVSFIAKCLEEKDHKALFRACVNRMYEMFGSMSVFEDVFEDLRERHKKTPLQELYSKWEFPKGKDAYKLGGHDKELGYINIDFVKKDKRWYLLDIDHCR